MANYEWPQLSIVSSGSRGVLNATVRDLCKFRSQIRAPRVCLTFDAKYGYFQLKLEDSAQLNGEFAGSLEPVDCRAGVVANLCLCCEAAKNG